MVAVGFPLYKGDYNFLKHLKEQGKVRHGELSKFMRQKFSAFVAEKAAQIKVKQTSIPAMYADIAILNAEGQKNSALPQEMPADIATSIGQHSEVQPISVYRTSGNEQKNFAEEAQASSQHNIKQFTEQPAKKIGFRWQKGQPAWNKGLKGVYHHNKITKQKIRTAKLGKKRPAFTDEWKLHLKEHHKGMAGHHQTLTTRRKITAALKRRYRAKQKVQL